MKTPTICPVALRELRLARGMSVEQLSDRSTVSTSVLYRLESGLTTRPYLETVRLLAKALKVEPSRLLPEVAAAKRRVARLDVG